MFAKWVDAPSGQANAPAVAKALHPGEIILLALLGGLITATVVLAALRGQAVDWASFAPAIGMSLMMVAVGVYARVVKQAARLGLGVIGFGIFMAFTGSVSILAFTVFPFVNPRVDPQLMALDASVGFVWLDFVERVASVPHLGLVLRHVYESSLVQMVLVILLLAFLDRPTQLHRFLLTGIIAMMVTLTIWHNWPSIGPPAYVTIAPELAARSSLMADQAVGAMLLGLANHGAAVITPDIVTGTVSFPSYHLIMALMVVWFTRGTVFFAPVLVVNLAMVPATILHGGHHVIDLAGGIVTFGLCLWIACRIVPRANPEPAA
jgi:hypothetical protein